MTDYALLLDTLTEFFENVPPAGGTPKATGSVQLQWPFYIDNSGHLNFGYGLDFTAYGSENAINILIEAGILQADLDKIDEYLYEQNNIDFPTPMTVSQLNAQISQGDWTSLAKSAVNAYYEAAVVPKFSTALAQLGLTFLQLPSGVATGLMDLLYNAPSAITNVPNLASAIQSKDWGAVAFAVQFNPNISDTDTHRVRRRIAEAMYILGFTPTFDGSSNVTSIEPTEVGSVNVPALIKYIELIASSGPGLDVFRLPDIVLSDIQDYLLENGYIVPTPAIEAESATDTWGTISNAVDVLPIFGAL